MVGMLQRTTITPSATVRGGARRRGRVVLTGLAAASLALGAAACEDDDDDLDTTIDLDDEVDEGVDDLEDGVDDVEDEIDEGVDELDDDTVD